jgi:hypothetical protein
MPGRTPLAALPYGNNIQYPAVQVNGGANSENQPPARSDVAADSKSVISSSPAIARGDQSAVESTTEEDQIS